MQKFLRLEFIPASSDLGLLVLRLGLGGAMLWLHGWGKLMRFINGGAAFPDVLGLGSTPSLLLAIFAEVICSVLLIVGFYTRLAALFHLITMAVALFVVHNAVLTGPSSGELALLYLTGALVLLFAGAGKYSFDKK